MERSDDVNMTGSMLLRLEDMEEAGRSVALLADMLAKLDSSSSEIKKGEAIDFLVDQCRIYKKRVVFLLEKTRSSAMLYDKGLSLNEALTNVLSQHDAITKESYLDAGSSSKSSVKRGLSGELVREEEHKRKFEDLTGFTSAMGEKSLRKDRNKKESGWRFVPSDAELFEYLKFKIANPAYQARRIKDGDVYSSDPNDLAGSYTRRFLFGKRTPYGTGFLRQVVDNHKRKIGEWRKIVSASVTTSLGSKSKFLFIRTGGEIATEFYLEEYYIDKKDVWCIYVIQYKGPWTKEEHPSPVRFGSSDSDDTESEKRPTKRASRSDVFAFTGKKSSMFAEFEMGTIFDDEASAKELEFNEFAENLQIRLEKENDGETEFDEFAENLQIMLEKENDEETEFDEFAENLQIMLEKENGEETGEGKQRSDKAPNK